MLDDLDMNAVFQALASESRRRILDIVKEKPGIVVGALAAEFDVSRIAVIKHLRVLEEAGLLHSEKIGRTRQLYFNAVPVQMIYDRWTTEYSAYWSGNVTRLKYATEVAARTDANTKKKRRK